MENKVTIWKWGRSERRQCVKGRGLYFISPLILASDLTLLLLLLLFLFINVSTDFNGQEILVNFINGCILSGVAVKSVETLMNKSDSKIKSNDNISGEIK